MEQLVYPVTTTPVARPCRYTDTETALLPFIDPKHPHAREWRTRRRSCERLVSLLHATTPFTRILEVNCSNGWLTAKIAENTDACVTGIDHARPLIDQAERVFRHERLKFLPLSIADIDDEETYDVIIINTPGPRLPAPNVMLKAANLLRPGGRIYMMGAPSAAHDTVFGRLLPIRYPRLIPAPALND